MATDHRPEVAALQDRLRAFMRDVVVAFPYRIRKALTDKGRRR